MKKSLVLLLIIPVFIFAQKQQNTNELHNRSFWKTKPDVTTVKQKIDEGNDPVTLNAAAFDAICFAIRSKAPVATVEYLLSIAGNDINKPTHDGRSYLMWAGATGDIDMMKLLIKKGADTKIVGSHGFNWFTFTVNAGYDTFEIYDLMVSNNVDLKQTNRAGANGLLLIAPHAKDDKIIKYFQDKGLDISATDKFGNNILFYAAKGGNTTLIKTYIAQGIDYKKENTLGENLVLFASQGRRGYSNPIGVFKFLDSLGIDMTKTNHQGENALHNIASNTKDANIIDFFIDKGVNVYQKDKEGNTAFLNAARGNNLLVLKKLTPIIKDINHQNAKGYAAITFATQRMNVETFQFLKEKGANLNSTDTEGNNLYYHLFNAYNKRNSKHFETFAKALTDAGVSLKNASKKEHPLHIAIAKRENKLIKKAIALGADVNQQNSDGLTPLHLAAMKANDIMVLKLLISKGADTKALTDFEESAYDLALENELLKNKDITFLK
ncbi:ankyrin repeat domain-containing protein [Aquimarina intermedia]|uniref:Ankyrin repeat protein n=1 Tax=Aquimarina intermedia TaxID=350814 RepID=A0A5S5C2C8_9FLAO|nr:ankyrin repeat domain-containing protein [Aquimarina intermedia]TYP72123.1 ankyrin repeat protein [Aquimarina intermedia]